MNLPECVSKKYGIFTMNNDFANKMIDDYTVSHNCKLRLRRKSAYENTAIMEDGTEYRQIRPIDNSRGQKCAVGVIDLATCNQEFIRDWIPSICIFADKGDFIFKDSSRTNERSKSYDLITLIDRLQKIAAIKGNIEDIGFWDAEYGLSPLSYIKVGKEGITFDTYC